MAAVGVSFAYGARRVLRGIDLRIAAGEILGILGPNGSGKSTLLRIFGGALSPEQGEVRLGGRPVRAYGARERAKWIAFVPQEVQFAFPFTVAEVVLMGRSPHLGGALFEGEADIAAARAAMSRVGVLDLAGRPVDELSGGERQLVAVACALAQETPILLLDEPTAFLDIRHELAIYELLRELRGEGRTVVVALHDLNLAALYCERLALLARGELVAAGSPEEVVTPSNVERAYETAVTVHRNPLTGAVSVAPRGARREIGPRRGDAHRRAY